MFIITINLLLPVPVLAGSSEPNEDTFFEYEYKQSVDNCEGAYSGYNEETKGTGRYDVLNWGPTEARVKVKFQWTYENDEGEYDSGTTATVISFSLSTREYTSEDYDVDDFYYGPDVESPLYQWIWIDPDIKKGTRVKILDSEGVVTNKDATVWSRFVAYKAIEVKVTGAHSRNDDYGIFDYDFTDKLYFDKVTGMFFAERYEEWDDGYWEGESASFRLFIELDVTRSSYEVEIDWLTLIGTYLLIIFATLGIIFLIAYPIYRIRWAGRNIEVKSSELFSQPMPFTDARIRVRVRRVWKMRDFPHRDNHATDHFRPFLEHWAKKSLLAKDRVAVAVSGNHGLLGYAIYNKESKIGTILCKSTELNEYLRYFIRCKDFFSESKHVILEKKDSISSNTDRFKPFSDQSKQKKDAYNIFETYNIYKLTKLRKYKYDTKLVRPMTKSDLREVATLAKKIFKVKARRWLKASLFSGELGMVAVIQDRIVGFGFAEVCGNFGRLHTLAVEQGYRCLGIGKELHNARLEAMRLLGVTEVVDEIADWNLASIRISSLSGFEKVGKMYVETIRSRRIKKNIVRR